MPGPLTMLRCTPSWARALRLRRSTDRTDQGQEQQRQEDGGGADDEGDLLRLQPGAVRPSAAGLELGEVVGRRRRRGRKVDVGRGFQRSVPES